MYHEFSLNLKTSDTTSVYYNDDMSLSNLSGFTNSSFFFEVHFKNYVYHPCKLESFLLFAILR